MAEPHILTKCINCECMSSAFKKLTPCQLTTVDSRRTEIKYKKGEILCKEGSFISSLIFIKKGLVKLYLDRGNEPLVISIEKHGSFIGLPSIYGKKVFHYSAEAIEDTEVCLTDINMFTGLLEKNSKFSSEIVKLVNNDLTKSYDRLYSLTTKQIRARFAELLLHFMEDIYESTDFDLQLSRKGMADIVSTSNESVSRLIKEFKEKKYIELDGNACKIKDVEGLKLISCET